jgi:hypothetical protein
LLFSRFRSLLAGEPFAQPSTNAPPCVSISQLAPFEYFYAPLQAVFAEP